ncbi:MAG: methyltransferase [Pleurocapsa sp. MO_226.B13]|nr:methyltransferase [Pleurocapsa sp. MO_226.B13]
MTLPVQTVDQTEDSALRDTLFQAIAGMSITQLIYAVAKLGIADLLKDGTKSYEELAESTQTHAPSLYRILRTLASMGIFAEVDNCHFQLTPLAEYLRSDIPHSMRGLAIWMGGENFRWQTWDKILYSIKTGKPAFDYVNGMSLFDYFEHHPEAATVFNDAMTSTSAIYNSAIVADYDFSSIKTLVDIGGGQGYFLTAILQANPHLQGIVYDLPHVVSVATRQIDALKLNQRCTIASGSFFESVPSGGDTYMMKLVLHDWDDRQAIQILKNCHAVMGENSKILVIENLIPSGNQPSIGKLTDIEMLLMTSGGRERTQDEFAQLFATAGFQLTKITPTSCPLSAIEGIKV